MKKRLLNSIEMLSSGRYFLWGESEEVHEDPDSAEWFSWLERLKSFHFSGRVGHFTARKEKKQRGTKGYWYAYRKSGERQYRRYLGTTDKLTISRLEEISGQIHAEVLQNQPKERVRKPRKKPVLKATLRYRIAELEKTVETQQARIRELEQELREMSIQKAREIVQNREPLL